MNASCPACASCGMPLEKSEDHAQGNQESIYCCYCTNPDGTLKSYEHILEGTASYFVYSQGLDSQAAYTMAKTILSQLPAWRK